MTEMPDFEEVNRLFRYDPDTGLLWRKERDPSEFKRLPNYCKYVKSMSEPAGSPSQGYLIVNIAGRLAGVHRVAWLLTHGQWPKHEIDHINGIKNDNRLSNLRDVPRGINHKNRALQSNNKTGCPGITYMKRIRKWKVLLRTNGKSVFLGQFAEKDDAIAARKAGQEKYGFHPNHGRAA